MCAIFGMFYTTYGGVAEFKILADGNLQILFKI